MMAIVRTTVNLDDDVFEIDKEYAANQSLAIGKALSELVRRGIAAPAKTRIVNGLTVFDLPGAGEKVTSAKVKKLLEGSP
jgi:hypothetical protein